MNNVKYFEVKGSELKKIQSQLVISKDKPIYQVIFNDKIPFCFTYTSLNDYFKMDLNKILNNDFNNPNAFLYAKNIFTLAFEHLFSMFEFYKELPCFSGKYLINVYLSDDFDEFCLIGVEHKLNLPKFAQGRVSGNYLIYMQKAFLSDSRKYNNNIPEGKYLGDAHELLHIFFNYNYYERWGNLNFDLPFLLSEGLTVICAKQLNQNFKEKFVSPEHLFLRNDIHVFDWDKRWITENTYYQLAGHFMHYLLILISKKNKISYKGAFQQMFNTIGNPKYFIKNQNKYDTIVFFQETFNINICKEYERFLNVN